MRIGIDLGGTKIEAAALDHSGAILERKRVSTPQGDYHRTVRAVADLVRELESNLRESGSVGIGIPGALSPANGLIKNANSTCLIGRPLDRDLELALGRPVRLANDANCFALSEASDGAGAGCHTVFGVILGTGVGAGIVVDGRALTGLNAIAGEWGHNPLPYMTHDERPGPDCYCGRAGCIETFVSGPALLDGYLNSLGNGSGERPADVQALARTAEQGEEQAAAHLELYVHRLARALAGVINILDPDIIVLGGGLSNLALLYRRLPEILPEFVFSDRVDTRIVPPKHGDSSGVRGAAWLWDVDERAQALARRA